jgi:hypothetical protein
MVSGLRKGEDRQYYVGLVGYYIEGIPYSASGLSVDRDATPDGRWIYVHRNVSSEHASTEHREEKWHCQAQYRRQIREVVRVKLEVMLHDIWSVAEFIDGAQHDLFLVRKL